MSIRQEMSEQTTEELEAVKRHAAENLSESVMPFWAENAWDEEFGGFLTRLDRSGKRLDDSEKFLMMQARMIAALSWAHEFGLQDRGYLELAGRTFDFLVTHMWDRDEEGFYFSVDRRGKPLSRRKNSDAHAYALTALAVYRRVSGRVEAAEYADRLFDLLQEQARDPEQGGYWEDFDGKVWEPLNAEQMHIGGGPTAADLAAAEQADAEGTEAHGGAQIKTVDMHTNMLEAFLYLYEVTGNPRHAAALTEVRDLILAHGIDSRRGCTITAFAPDWTPLPDAAGLMTTSFGLNVELAWLLLEAERLLPASGGDAAGGDGGAASGAAAATPATEPGAAGVEPTVPRGTPGPGNAGDRTPTEVALGLLEHALAHGFDHSRGGLAAHGPYDRHADQAHELPPDSRYRPWWSQVELLNALTSAHRITQDERYLTALVTQWDWIRRYQIDHEQGDWYQEIDPATCRPLSTDKGGEWKTAFHTSRALIRTATGLNRV